MKFQVGSEVTSARDPYLLLEAIVSFGLWLLAIGPGRTWASGAGVGAQWVAGIAPSFFAGITWSLWQAFTTRTGPATSVACSAVMVTLAEIVQLVLPHYRADVWDIAAGILGAGLALPVLLWHARRASPTHRPRPAPTSPLRP